MPPSTCIKCDNTEFALVETQPQNSAYKMHFIQCTHCGGVIGVTDYHDIGTKIDKLGMLLEHLAKQLRR